TRKKSLNGEGWGQAGPCWLISNRAACSRQAQLCGNHRYQSKVRIGRGYSVCSPAQILGACRRQRPGGSQPRQVGAKTRSRSSCTRLPKEKNRSTAWAMTRRRHFSPKCGELCGIIASSASLK